MQPNRKLIFIIPLLVAIISLALFFMAVANHWFGEDVGAGANFCEHSSGLIKQPVNTFSNFAFVIVGLLIGWDQAHGRFSKNANIITQSRFVAGFYATLAVLLGPGSMAMHATMSAAGGFLDMLSMYLMASFIFTFAMVRSFRWGALSFLIIFSISLAILLYINQLNYEVPFVGFIGSFFFGVFLIMAAIIELINYFIRKIQIDVRFGFASILLMALALFIWKMSFSGNIWCSPTSLIQGHGIWHILCAIAVYTLYRYYVSENRTQA